MHWSQDHKRNHCIARHHLKHPWNAKRSTGKGMQTPQINHILPYRRNKHKKGPPETCEPHPFNPRKTPRKHSSPYPHPQVQYYSPIMHPYWKWLPPCPIRDAEKTTHPRHPMNTSELKEEWTKTQEIRSPVDLPPQTPGTLQMPSIMTWNTTIPSVAPAPAHHPALQVSLQQTVSLCHCCQAVLQL